MRRPKVEDKGARDRARKMDALTKSLGSFKPAREAMRPVRVVPTCMVQLDHALRVGGWPLERIASIHGPSHMGKSLAAILLVLSFLERGHLAFYLDTEQTTAIDWVAKLIGPHADNPCFRASRTSVYEDAVEEVREFSELTRKMREDGTVDKDASAIVVVDSLRKLVPRGLFKKVSEGDGGIDGASGRAEQIKARYNAAWLDELVPLASRTGVSVNFILREHQDTEADAWARKFGNDYKIGGGKAVVFDSSLLMRVTRASWVKDGSGEDATIIGERHRITISKSKIAGKEGKVSVAHFHSSNGRLVPEGHDRARDVLDLAEQFGIVEKKGSSVVYDGKRVGQGMNAAVKHLTLENRALLEEIERACRARFADKAPVEYDETTGEFE